MSSLAIRSDLFKGSLFSRLLLTWSSPKVIGLELHPLGQLNMWGNLLEEFFFFFFFGGDQNIIIEEKSREKTQSRREVMPQVTTKVQILPPINKFLINYTK